MIILGIDPGQSGGIAKLKQDGERWQASAVSMPATERDIADHFWTQYQEATEEGIEIVAFLEQVQVMPAIRRVKSESGEQRIEANPGIVSTAKFMQGYGYLRGCLITIGIAVEDVRPQAWQKALGCMTRGNKNISKAKCQQLFPNLRITHAIADSLLIAEFGRRARAGGGLFAQSPKIVDAPAPWETIKSSEFKELIRK